MMQAQEELKEPIAIIWHYLLRDWRAFPCYDLDEVNSHIKICRGEYFNGTITTIHRLFCFSPWFIEWLQKD